MFSQPILDSRRLTNEEKAWLKTHYGGEFKFLQTYGLSIYRDEDREEGRRILRSILKDADSNSEDLVADEDAEEEEEEENGFLADLESDPSSHVADMYFTHEQLDWIETHYRHSGNFLMRHGLKFYDADDCKEGAAIAAASMKQD
jgi:hypothetical protein